MPCGSVNLRERATTIIESDGFEGVQLWLGRWNDSQIGNRFNDGSFRASTPSRRIFIRLFVYPLPLPPGFFTGPLDLESP